MEDLWSVKKADGDEEGLYKRGCRSRGGFIFLIAPTGIRNVDRFDDRRIYN